MCVSALLLAACAGKPATPVTPVTTQPVAPNPTPVVEPVVEPKVEVKPAFDPAAVTVEQKQTAFFDIRAFIEDLNGIVQRKDYAGWSSHLTEELHALYSDPAFLAATSENATLKRAGIRLNTARDYFVYVVYPSHQYDRVDDIEFVSESRVKAITISRDGERLLLYYLEKTGDTWKIGMGR